MIESYIYFIISFFEYGSRRVGSPLVVQISDLYRYSLMISPEQFFMMLTFFSRTITLRIWMKFESRSTLWSFSWSFFSLPFLLSFSWLCSNKALKINHKEMLSKLPWVWRWWMPNPFWALEPRGRREGGMGSSWEV